jgi:drug/metabolite transporter (DMT)-like permease
MTPAGDSKWRAYGALMVAVGGITWSAIFVRWAGALGPVSAFYRVLIAAGVLVPWWLAVTYQQREAAAVDHGGASDTPSRNRDNGALPTERARDTSLGILQTSNGESFAFESAGAAVAAKSGDAEPRAAARRMRWIAVASGVFFALDIALWNTAVMTTQAAIASLLGNLTPVWVGLMSWIVLSRRPPREFWIGTVVSLVGCVLIVSAHLDPNVATGTLIGDALAIVACMFFAAYLLSTERVRVAMDTLTFNTLAITGSLVTLAVVCVAFGLPLTGYPPKTWLALAGLGLLSQLGAYYALVYALGHLPATVTSVSLLAQVPGTAILAALLLGEPLSLAQIIGSAIVLVGICIVNARKT